MQQTGAGWVSGWILRGMKCVSNFLLELSSGNTCWLPQHLCQTGSCCKLLQWFFGWKWFCKRLELEIFFNFKGPFCGKFPIPKDKKHSPQIIFQGKKNLNWFFPYFDTSFFFGGSFWVGGFPPVFDRFLQTCCQLMLNPFSDAHYSLMQWCF